MASPQFGHCNPSWGFTSFWPALELAAAAWIKGAEKPKTSSCQYSLPQEDAMEENSELDRKNRSVHGLEVASITEEARSMAEQQKAAGAERVARLGQAVHGAADEIGRELPQAAQIMHSAAQRLESVSEALRERSLGELGFELKSLTRRQPAATFVGWVAAGFALSRFLKSGSNAASAKQNSMFSNQS
jgi:hypothetical protein